MLAIIVLYLLYSTNLILNKTALAYTQPLFYTAIRLLLAGALQWLYLFFMNRRALIIKKEHLFLFAKSAFFTIYLCYVLGAFGMKLVSASQFSFFLTLSPAITALLSYVQLREKLTQQQMVGLSVGLLGFLPLLAQQGAQPSLLSLGGLLALASTVIFAYGWVLVRSLVHIHHYSPVAVNAVTMLSGGILALLTSLAFDTWNPIPATDWKSVIPLLAAVIAVGDIATYALYGWLLNRYTATLMSFAGILYPAMSIFFGWWFLHEQVTPNTIISFLLIACGLFIFYQQELKYPK